MGCTTLHLLSFLCGLFFGIIGIVGAALLSYYANQRFSVMMKEHSASRLIIDDIHRLTNSAYKALQDSNELLKTELSQAKKELAQLIQENLEKFTVKK